MSFQECELAILRASVDKAEENIGKREVSSPDVKKIVVCVEKFLRKKRLIVYGGTAINSILPKQDKFYNKEVDLPDYDFFSPHALNDAKELCDFYVDEGFIEVEAKNGIHVGTYKVFVNFIAIADITYIHPEIFGALKKEAIQISGILYAPPNYLRMSLYLELSHPAGDISRWEKLLKRLILLSKNYPLVATHCDEIDFQRNMEDTKRQDEIFATVKTALIDQDVVFFGGYALSLYSAYMPPNLRKRLNKNPDFDVLSEEPLVTAQIVKERLHNIGIKNIKITKKPSIGEIVAPHYQITVGNDNIVFIYQPIACHSYNVIREHGLNVKIATIDTMLSFYLAFLYADRDYYDKDRILCIAQYLFKVQQENRLKQKGVLKRFSVQCYGHQETMEEVRAKKSEMYMRIKDHPNSKEYEANFLRYRPGDRFNKQQMPNPPTNPERDHEEFSQSYTILDEENEEPKKRRGKTQKKQKQKQKQKQKKPQYLYEMFNNKKERTKKTKKRWY
jgi:Poly(A) polymerase catalytic subunit